MPRHFAFRFLLSAIFLSVVGLALHPAVANATTPAPCAQPCTTTLTPDADTWLEEKNGDDNHGEDTELRIRTKQDDDKAALLRFNLDSAPSPFDEVTLRLTVTNDENNDANNPMLDLCQVSTAWLENEAAWENDGFGDDWDGGAHATPCLGSVDPSVAGQGEVLVSNAALQAVIEDWRDNNTDNHGLEILSTGGKTAEIRIGSRESSEAAALEFSYSCPNRGRISGRVWGDSNGNGVRETGEPLSFGVSVDLVEAGTSATLTTAVTDSEGEYSFACLSNDSFRIRVYPLQGIDFSPQGEGTDSTLDSDISEIHAGSGLSATISISSGQYVNDIDAGLADIASIPSGVNGLLHGDGDIKRYVETWSDGTASLLSARSTDRLALAFMADPSVTDNVFDEDSVTSYTQSAGWNKTRGLLKLYDTEKLLNIRVSCGAIAYNWTQSYLCKPGELEDWGEDSPSDGYGGWDAQGEAKNFTGPLLGSGGLQSRVEFQPAAKLPSAATSQGDYLFGVCSGRDKENPSGNGNDGIPPDYQAATSLAWNLNNTIAELATAAGDLSKNWKSPSGSGDSALEVQWPLFDQVHLWEWRSIYEMEFDVSACGDNPITIEAASMHSSPAKGSEEASFPATTLSGVFFDYGDLPSRPGYPTEGASAARHGYENGTQLGADWDSEATGVGSPDAEGDDRNLHDDEDGIEFPILAPSGHACLEVTASRTGFLNSFVDWNDDEDFSDNGENPSQDLMLNSGTNQVCIDVPQIVGDTIYARFRYTSDDPGGTLGAGGSWPNGEVEDYLLTIQRPKITVDATLYLGHNGGAGCAGVERVDAPAGTQLTYCFEVTNSGATPLSDITLTDGVLGINRSDLSLITSASASEPLAPGEKLWFYYETTVGSSAVSTMGVTGTPSDASGNALAGVTLQTDQDPARIEVLSAELQIEKTVYAGHDSGAGCPGIDTLGANQNAAITYCFVITNDGEAALAAITLDDAALGIDRSLASSLPALSGVEPLATGETLAFYYESTLDDDLINTATATGAPWSSGGVAFPAAATAQDSDQASVSLAIPGPSPTPPPTPSQTPPPSPSPTPGPAMSPTPTPALSPTPEPTSTPAPTPDGNCAHFALVSAGAPLVLDPQGGEVIWRHTIFNPSSVETLTVTDLIDTSFGDLDGSGDCLMPQVLAPGMSYSCAITESLDPIPTGQSLQTSTQAYATLSSTGEDSTCIEGSTIWGYAQAPTACLKCRSKLMFKGQKKDFFATEGLFSLEESFDPENHEMAIQLSDESGPIYTALLEQGRFVRKGRKYQWKDKSAKKGPGRGLQDGLYKVRLKYKGDDQWQLQIRAYDDLSGVTSGNMSISVVLGNRGFIRSGAWIPSKKGWILNGSP